MRDIRADVAEVQLAAPLGGWRRRAGRTVLGLLSPAIGEIARHLQALHEKVDHLGARMDRETAELRDQGSRDRESTEARVASVEGRMGSLDAALTARQDELAERVGYSLAFGWDYVATVERLALLESRVAELTARVEVSGAANDDGARR